MAYSEDARREIAKINSGDPLLTMIEIDHQMLAAPARFVNDDLNLVSNGQLFIKTRFSLAPPSNKSHGMPRATLRVDNVGRELIQWLEVSNGGAGATCRMMQVRRSAPNDLELDLTLNLSRLSADTFLVAAELGYPDLNNQLGCAMNYTDQTTPGLF